MTTTLFHTSILMTLLTLTLPLLMPQTSAKHIMTSIKLSSTLSLLPTMLFINHGIQSTTTTINWLPTYFNINLTLNFDTYSTLFIPTALLVTWAILEFTMWYMIHDPELNKFMKYLLIFLLAMVTLITANSLFQLFIGWEGVGIMSFLLIGWWHARTNANTSALQAVIYNRIGDIGLILALAWTAMHLNTWELQQMTTHPNTPTLPLLGLVLAATGKSAQFGLHPWLPAAMEGPTPVSALLHSSTMVVAGILLLIRLSPMMQTNHTITTLCLCLGAMTTTFAALCALTQNDIKKIIAFSTSSQLGLMMLTIGLNQPEWAFLHILTHAFFKAMLFLCSGSIIHNLMDEQDIRKMGNMQNSLPLTTTCLTLGNLALAGTPFLAGFFTKDTILEILNTSHLNAWALITTLMATAMTAAYSLRLTLYVQTGPPNFKPNTDPNEDKPHQVRPLMRLAIGSIITGLALTSMHTPQHPQTMTMSTATKLTAITITIMGLLLALDLTKQSTNCKPKQTWPHSTLLQLGFFNTIIHRTHSNYTLTQAQNTALMLNDLLWYEHLGPKVITATHLTLTNKLSRTHTGLIKTHLTAFITLMTATIMTMIYY